MNDPIRDVRVNKSILNAIFNLLNDYAECIESIGKIPVTGNALEIKKDILLPYLVLMYGKMMTAYRILNGYTLEDLHPEVKGISYDSFVCYDIVRAVYECFLQITFLIDRYQSDEEMKYIGLWWHVRAFSERSIIAGNRMIFNEKLNEEAATIKTYTEEILKQYPEILLQDAMDFTKKKTESLASWPTPYKLHSLAGIDKSHHYYLYKLHSIYAHSEPLALLQIGSAFRENKNKLELVNTFTHSKYLFDFSLLALEKLGHLFEEVKVIFNNNSDRIKAFEAAKRWYSTSIPKLRDELERRKSTSSQA